MLSLFPSILWLAPFSALLLRLCLAVFLGTSGWQRFGISSSGARILGGIEMVLAVAFFLGAWTQAAALLSAVICAGLLLVPRMNIVPRSTIAFAFVISLSLLVTGAGAIAFDLPL